VARRNLKKLKESLQGGARTNPGAGLAVEPAPSLVIAYSKQIIKQVSKPFWADINSILMPVLERLEPQYSKNYLANDQVTNEIMGTLKGIGNVWGDIGPTANNLATKWADENDEFHREKFVDYLDTAVSVNVDNILTDVGVQSQLESAIEVNADLITSIPEKDLERIEKVIFDGLKEGNDFRSLRKEIMDITGMDERRAKLIARDQTSKLNGNLNRVRQLDVGITGYFWRTTGDGPPRVRATHWANRNKRFRWDSPPSKTGHPGHDVNCRCYADPDLRTLKQRTAKPSASPLDVGKAIQAAAKKKPNIRHRELFGGRDVRVATEHNTLLSLRANLKKTKHVKEFTEAIKAHEQTLKAYEDLQPGVGLTKAIRAAKRLAKRAQILTRDLP
jgi:SPP1 gp7 family putative phage head morphogenesis protein